MAKISKSRLSSFALLVALAAPFGAEAKVHPYSASYESRISELFLSGGQPSNAKIDAYIARMQTKRNEVIQLLVNAEKAKASKKGKEVKLAKIQEEALEEDITVSLTTAIDLLQKMKGAKALSQIMDLGYDALDLEDTIRVKGKDLLSTALVTHIAEVFTTWTVEMKSKASEEASNLVADDGSYLSISDIEALKAKNADLSKFNPDGSKEFWQSQSNISKVDVEQAALGRTLDIYKGSNVKFAPDATYILDEVVHADTKPKMAAYVLDEKGKKVKFRLKFTNEVHAEPTAAALSMTLGFPADIHKFEKTVKVIIGKKTLSDVTRDWEIYYPRNDVREPKKIEESIVTTGVDPKLGNFIVFRNVSVEARPKGVDRVGGWQLGANGNDARREARAMMLVSMWMDNSDYQDFKNNKLLARIEDGKVVSKVHTISDLGHSFGGVSQEDPDNYKPNMVKSRSNDKIVMTYKSFTDSPIKNRMTYSDVKWSARLIAQLTRPQIQKAFELGGWPSCFTDIYVEKAISRRNDLVKNFGLLGEKQKDGSTIQLMPAAAQAPSIKQACGRELAPTEIKTGFEYSLDSLLGAAGRASIDLALDGARAAVGGISQVRIAPARFNPRNSLTKFVPVVEVLASAPRTIEKNPNPTSENDLFIVKDEFELGIRLGVAYGIYKDFVVSRRYAISYPVRTMDEGRVANGFVVNAVLPLDLRKGKVPAKYVLKTETFLSHGVGVEMMDPTSPLSPGLRIGKDKVFLGRAILDARDEKQVLLYRDEAKYTQTIAEAFARIGIFKIPLFSSIGAKGTSEGRAVILKRQEVVADAKVQDSLAAAVANGDFTPFEKAEQKLTLEREFASKKKGWNLLIWKGNTETDFDHIKLTEEDDAARDTVQLRSTKTRSFSFFDNKETHSVRIEVSGANGQAGARRVTVKAVGLDANTKDKELSKGYLSFINGLSMTGRKVIDFTPELGYSINGKWGKTLTESETTIYPEGLNRILSMTEGQFWAALAKVSGTTAPKMMTMIENYKKALTSTGPRDTTNVQSRMDQVGINRETYNLIGHSIKVLSGVKKVQKATEDRKAFERIGAMFREAVYGSGSFYEPRVLAALNTIAGESNVYGRHLITTVGLGEVNLLGEVPLVGEVGKRREDVKDAYIIVKPQTALDLYNMFDSWF